MKTLIWKDTGTIMFIAALFTTAKAWEQPKSPSGDDWLKTIWNTHTHTHTHTQLASLVAQWYRIHLPSRRLRFDPWIRKITWRRNWPSTPVYLPREIHGQRSQAGYSPWDCKEWDTTERLNNTTKPSCRVWWEKQSERPWGIYYRD